SAPCRSARRASSSAAAPGYDREAADAAPSGHAGATGAAAPRRTQSSELSGSRPTDLSRPDSPRPADGGEDRRTRRGSPRPPGWTAPAASDITQPYGAGSCSAAGGTIARPSRRQASFASATARAPGRREDPTAAAP